MCVHARVCVCVRMSVRGSGTRRWLGHCSSSSVQESVRGARVVSLLVLPSPNKYYFTTRCVRFVSHSGSYTFILIYLPSYGTLQYTLALNILEFCTDLTNTVK